MKWFLILIIAAFAGCQENNEKTCEEFESLTIEEGEVLSLDCCEGEIVETGYALTSGELTYSHNTMNCGGCGTFCHNGCLCTYEAGDLSCGCTGTNTGGSK